MRLVASVGVLAITASAALADSTFAIDFRARDKTTETLTFNLEAALRVEGSAKTATTLRMKGTRKDRVAASTDDCPEASDTKCAAEMGAKLGVDYMVFGLVDVHRTKYTINVNVINIATKKRVRSFRDIATGKTDVKKWAKRIYGRLTDDAIGSFVVTSNAQKATVFIDGQPVAQLFQGKATIMGLALGTHRVELKAEGFKPYAGDADVDGETPINVLLVQTK